MKIYSIFVTNKVSFQFMKFNVFILIRCIAKQSKKILTFKICDKKTAFPTLVDTNLISKTKAYMLLVIF